MRERIVTPVMMWGGRKMTPVKRVSDGLITLLTPRDARAGRRAGTYEFLSEQAFNHVLSVRGTGYNLDAAYSWRGPEAI